MNDSDSDASFLRGYRQTRDPGHSAGVRTRETTADSRRPQSSFGAAGRLVAVPVPPPPARPSPLDEWAERKTHEIRIQACGWSDSHDVPPAQVAAALRRIAAEIDRAACFF